MPTRPKPRKVLLAPKGEPFNPNTMYLVVGCGIPNEPPAVDIVMGIFNAAREVNKFSVFITNVDTLAEFETIQTEVARLAANRYCYFFQSAKSLEMFERYVDSGQRAAGVKYFSKYSEEQINSTLETMAEIRSNGQQSTQS